MTAPGSVVWLTGLSGAGKSTLAEALRAELTAAGGRVEVLDGDEVRAQLNSDLGFSKSDRDTNIRRIGYVAGLLARNGVTVIVAAISPYRDARDAVRASVPRFVEVFVQCSLPELRRRDTKGLYQRALAGEISNLTGVNDPYEAPLHPEVTLDTERETVDTSVRSVLESLARRGYTHTLPNEAFATEDDTALAAELPRIDASNRDIADLYMLATGALAPLTGFVGSRDYASILECGRLASGAPYTIPVVLRLNEPPRGERIALYSCDEPLGLVDIQEVFATDASVEARAIYGTDDLSHPGVSLLHRSGRVAVAGGVTLLRRPTSAFPFADLTPREVRAAKQTRAWRTMVGFQTRNPLHRGHEYLQKVALELVDGLLLHPIVGETKEDDISASLRMRSYRALLAAYYPADRTLLAANPAWMRYAGPKEAVFHALIRRNYGCTHFIVGRDHAGVGSFYDSYAAHRIFDDYDREELGIDILRFENAAWCKVCGAVASARTCPHAPEDRSTLSGSEVRSLLREGRPLPPDFSRPEVSRILADRPTGVS